MVRDFVNERFSLWISLPDACASSDHDELTVKNKKRSREEEGEEVMRNSPFPQGYSRQEGKVLASKTSWTKELLPASVSWL